MDITWYGLSCFRITERSKTSIVTDPYAPAIGIAPANPLKADIVTCSHDAPGHNHIDLIKSEPYVITGPGEYEIGGTFVTGIPLHSPTDLQQRYNVGYLFNYDQLSVLHLGDLNFVPDQSVIQDLGEVNVLLLPVGGGSALTAAQASEVVALIEPNYIIPMHYAIPGLTLKLEPVDKFLKAMGVGTIEEEEMFRVTSGDMPEQPQVVLLKPNL